MSALYGDTCMLATDSRILYRKLLVALFAYDNLVITVYSSLFLILSAKLFLIKSLYAFNNALGTSRT